MNAVSEMPVNIKDINHIFIEGFYIVTDSMGRCLFAGVRSDGP